MVLRNQAIRIKLSFLIGFSVIAIYFLGLFTRMYPDKRLELEDGIHQDEPTRPVATMEHGSEKSRKNIIIVSHGRSGSRSTLMGDIVNHHPSVFYMYEPLQTTQRVLKQKQIRIWVIELITILPSLKFLCLAFLKIELKLY